MLYPKLCYDEPCYKEVEEYPLKFYDHLITTDRTHSLACLNHLKLNTCNLKLTIANLKFPS